jgi:hypothetical protein
MTPDKLTWRDAIETVLRDSADPMHYTDIAEEVATRKLRGDELGATPANTVATVITVSMRDEGSHSPFVRTERGVYALRDKVEHQAASGPLTVESPTSGTEIQSEATGLVSAFGMFWDRAKVAWGTQPKILGQQQAGSNPVDFGDQRGVYLLHDAQGVVYVGRATDQGLGRRLGQHINDRLGGRWTRFS